MILLGGGDYDPLNTLATSYRRAWFGPEIDEVEDSEETGTDVDDNGLEPVAYCVYVAKFLMKVSEATPSKMVCLGWKEQHMFRTPTRRWPSRISPVPHVLV